MRNSLRNWQKDAFQLYLTKYDLGDRELLFEATPGAGKTTTALKIVHHQLANKLSRGVVIVVPTSHLRIQWAQSALNFGLQLECSRVSNLSKDFHGAVITYQQLGRGGKWIKELARNSVIVLDEVHHAAEGLSWGEALRDTMKDAAFVLCLSGTAFRSDGNPIPYVKYSSLGESQPDYTYSYTRAVSERVCRPTAFFMYGGEISWSDNGALFTASFNDALDWTNSARRLRAALTPAAEWIQPMLKDAHQMLLETRSDDPDAAGLIVCADQKHAREVAKIILDLTGERATVVLSDDATASKKIKQFGESSCKWLVACNMVSEGVDIPRLRIGVYATTIRTKMYFRQFLGRVVRFRKSAVKNQVAYVYLPSDPTLRKLAEEIEEESRHFLRATEPLQEERQERNTEKSEPTWTAVGALNSGVDAIIVQGNQLSMFGESLPSIREAVHQEIEIQRETVLTRSEKKTQLSSEIKTLVAQVHKRSKKPHSIIHTMLNKAQSVRSQTVCTEDQLLKRKNLLEEMLR